MLSTAILQKVLLFLFGAPHNVMYTAATFVGINFILDFFRKYEPPKTKKTLLHDILKRLLAYMAFIIIATRVDALAVDALFGWEGSTQFLVCLYIVAREIRVILDYIRAQGIDIPLILDSRIGQMERSETQSGGFEAMNKSVHTMPTSHETDPVIIDAKLKSLKSQIAHIESLRTNKDNHKTGGDTQ